MAPFDRGNLIHEKAEEVYEGAAEQAPSVEQREAVLWRWLEDLATESDRVRRQDAGFDMFEKWMDLYRGRHWPGSMPSFRPPIVVNELRSLILSEASDLSDANLRLYVMKDPKNGGRDEDAERAVRALWVREQVDLKLVEAMMWALILGTGYLRIGWDPDGHQGMGDVTVRSEDPRHVLPDPDATDDRNMRFVLFETVLDIQEIRRLFPRTGMRVKPEDAWSVQDRNSASASPQGVSWPSYMGPLHNDQSLLGRGALGYKKARARVLDLYVEDPTTETVFAAKTDISGLPMKDTDGNVIYEESYRPKYPKGRRIVGANGVILFDDPNPNPGGDKGVLRVILEPSLDSFWGQGFVQQTGELQMAADKLMSAVVENAIRLNNGIVVATTNTGLDLESFSGIPGQLVQINPGSTFEIKYPTPMPPDMISAPGRMLDMQRRVLGFPDSRGGTGAPGNRSAEMTETEISQAQGATRLRGRMMYYTVQRLCEMIFARMASNYMTERTIPAVEGENFKPVIWKPLDRPERYSIYVDPACFQIMSRTMLKRLGLALYRLRAIDRASLLEAIGWPEWEDTAKRLDQSEQMAAYMKMMAKRKVG